MARPRSGGLREGTRSYRVGPGVEGDASKPEAARSAVSKRSLPGPAVLSDGTVRLFLTLGPKGRVLIPADTRAAMKIAEGDVLVGFFKDGELRLTSAAFELERTRAYVRGLVPQGDDLIDDLIAQRRRDAERGD